MLKYLLRRLVVPPWNCNLFGMKNRRKSRNTINRNCNAVRNAMTNFPHLFVACMKISYRVYFPKDSTSNL